MAFVTLSSGRQIDNSCPYSGGCFADQYCNGPCPPTLLDVLIETARLEHECDLLPHTDPDLMEVCRKLKCVEEREKKENQWL